MPKQLDARSLTYQWRAVKTSYITGHLLDELRKQPNFDEDLVMDELIDIVWDIACNILGDEKAFELNEHYARERDDIEAAINNVRRGSSPDPV
jgi:hypothetical protein